MKIYILRRRNKEIKTNNVWKVRYRRLFGYKLVNQYDPTKVSKCKQG
jgi:hypothetical protein